MKKEIRCYWNEIRITMLSNHDTFEWNESLWDKEKWLANSSPERIVRRCASPGDPSPRRPQSPPSPYDMCSKEARGSRIGRHAAAHESQEDYAREQCRERTHGAEPRVEIWSTMRKLNMSRGVAWMIKQSWNRKVMMWNTSRSITWMLISCLHLPHKERMRFACPMRSWCFACHFYIIS